MKIHDQKNLLILKCDIRKIPRKVLKYKIDHIVHLAALGSVPRSFKDPIEVNSVNVDGSIKVMNLAHKLNCKSFVFASSSSVYGNSKQEQKKRLIPKNLLVHMEIQNILSKYMQKFCLIFII